MTERPQPRPALRRADDGTVHPASPRLSSLAVELSTPGTKSRKKRDKAEKAERAEERVDLVVTLPKSLRKRLRRKAEAHGWTPEEAAYQVLRVWVDG